MLFLPLLFLLKGHLWAVEPPTGALSRENREDDLLCKWGEMAIEMALQLRGISLLVLLEKGAQGGPEGIQCGAEGHVENLAHIQIIQQGRQIQIGEGRKVGQALQAGGDVVALAILEVAPARESGNLAEECRLYLRHDAQSLHIACTGGFQMDKAARDLLKKRVHAEFIGA